MITGFNNDIKYRGQVFHVQTEDKGEASAWIESLVYVGGRILARKRVTYKQLLDEGADKPAIASLMEQQHRQMIKQIRQGRFNEEGVDSGAPKASKAGADTPEESGIATARMHQQAEEMFSAGASGPEPEPKLEPVDPEAEAQAEAAAREEAAAIAALEAAVAEEEEAVVDLLGPPSEALDTGDSKVSAEGATPTLDQVIFDYLSTVAHEESLVLLMDESPALASATRTKMDLGTHASRSGKPVANAAIAVRMISKTGGPVTLAEGVTDTDGTLELFVDVPEVPSDSAALIISAASTIGNAEIKHLL